ncbi:MAG TPA: hypothetical protein VG936_03375 [Lacunisphaera sp.]|nr:hypothetical protein [Lacunisphaera sp.]
MMDDLEQHLQRARLAEPSADLDRRIEAAFSARRNPPAVAVVSMRHWWLGAIAAGLSLAAGLVVSIRREPPRPETVVYQIEAEGRLRDMLLNVAPEPEGLPNFAGRGTSP